MRSLTAAELGSMQDAQESAMMDVCVVQSYSATTDDYGASIAAYTDGDAVVCGLDPTGGEEIQGADMATIITDATLRLPMGTSIDLRDRIKVTHRYGAELTTADTYEVAGPVRRGPSGLRVDLKRVSV